EYLVEPGHRVTSRNGLVEGRAWPASEIDGCEADFRSRPAGHHSAHGLSEPEPVAFPRHRHLVDGGPGQLDGTRLGRPLSRFTAIAARSADWLEYDAGLAA